MKAATRAAASGGMGRAASAVVRAQLRLVKEEAREDSHRVLSGVGLLIAAAVLLIFVLAALDVALGLYIAAFYGPLPAALAVAGLDLFVAVVFILVARWRLSRPLLLRTRTMAHETALELRRI